MKIFKILNGIDFLSQCKLSITSYVYLIKMAISSSCYSSSFFFVSKNKGVAVIRHFIEIFQKEQESRSSNFTMLMMSLMI